MIDDGTDPVPVDIVSATKAKPCVVTVTALGAPVVGDIIVPRNTGWDSIEGDAFQGVGVDGGRACAGRQRPTSRRANDINTTGTPRRHHRGAERFSSCAARPSPPTNRLVPPSM